MNTLEALATATEERAYWTQAYAQLVARARAEGHSLGQIAKVTGTTRIAVSRLAKRYTPSLES